MKAFLFLAAITSAAVTIAITPLGQAQNELSIGNHPDNCPKCSAKQQEILKLQAEVAALKAGSTGVSESISEPVPITPPITPLVEATNQTPTQIGPMYTVQPGDSLMKIARKTNCKAADIATANDMAMDAIIHPGQILKLPTTATAAVPPVEEIVGETPKASQAKADPPSQAQADPPTQAGTYTIKQGETYYRISRNLKIPLKDLMAANPKIPANRLYAGRVIKLPTQGAVSTPAQSSPEPAAAQSTSTQTETVQDSSIEDPATDPEPLEEKRIVAVNVEQEISYGDFATKHGTTTERLNALNDLDLTSATILAKGSELYVPATPQADSN